jgi:hypothetical protein
LCQTILGMKQVEQLYFNDFGVAFFWKKNGVVLKDKVQLVFRETGFYLSGNEVQDFAVIIDSTFNEMGCKGCSHKGQCHKFLLKTPLNQVDLAVNHQELIQIKDLVEGALFHAKLFDYLDDLCMN